MPNYKDELKYQREYAKSQQAKSERSGSMTTAKRKAYGKTKRTADLYASDGASGKESYSDAAKNLMEGLARLGRMPKEGMKNLKEIERKSRR